MFPFHIGMSKQSFVTIWSSAGDRVKLRKHYMNMYLREAHWLFCNLGEENEISFAQFCKIRPPNVLLLQETPMDQCKCIIHENFFLKLEALGVPYERYIEPIGI